MEVKRMISIQSVFMRFLLWFCGIGGGTLGVCLFLYLSLFAGSVILPANYSETALENNREEIQNSEKVTDKMIIDGCTYGVYSNDGEFLYGTVGENQQEQVWQAYEKGRNGGGTMGYLKYFPRKEGVCIVQYEIKMMFANPVLREKGVSPWLILAAFLMVFFIEALILVRRFSRSIREELLNVKRVTEKVRHQDLEFERPKTKLREVDEVMDSLVQMKDALGVSLKTQWKMEDERRQQVSALVHDIKTPLTIIRGNAQLMKEAESEEESQEYQAFILQETERIEEYIHILQEILRNENSLSMKTEQVDLKEFIEDFSRQAKMLADSKNRNLDVDISGIPDYINIDGGQLQRAWENLLTNAIEYTPECGRILITIKAADNRLCYQIEDDGPGFSTEELHHAAEQFYQGDKSRASKNHYGMGLFMVQSFAKNQSGTLSIRNSGLTKGACIRLDIPVRESERTE